MPAPHQSTSAAGAGNDPVDIRASIYQGLIGRGLKPFQAMGVIYSLNGESAGFNPNAIGDGGKSFGWGQWNGARKASLDNVAQGMGTTWNDPSAQVAHFFNEIDGPYKGELDRVKQATTSADATRLWTGSVGEGAGYERPRVNNYQQRYGNGVQMGYVDPQTNGPVWKTAPASVVSAQGGTSAPAPGNAGATPTPADTRSPAQKFADAAKAGNVGAALGALSEGKDSEGKDTGGLLGKISQQMSQQPTAPVSTPMLQGAPDDQGAQAQAGQALLGQVLQQSAKPLSWSRQPFGSGIAGPIVPGTTLNSGYP